MSAIACDVCGGWIDGDQSRHPGFCSTRCRDAAQLERATKRQQRQAKRQAALVKERLEPVFAQRDAAVSLVRRGLRSPAILDCDKELRNAGIQGRR